MLWQPHLGGDVDHTQQAESRIEGEAHHVRQTVSHLALQQVIEADPRVFEVADEIAHSTAHEAGEHKFIGLGGGLDDHLVELLIEAEHGAVVAFERVAGIARRGASAQQDHRSREGKRRLARCA